MGRESRRGKRKFIVTRFDIGTHEVRAFPVRAADKDAALRMVKKSGMSCVRVQSVAGYHLRRLSLVCVVLGVGVGIAAGATAAVGWWTRNAAKTDAMMSRTDLAITASQGDKKDAQQDAAKAGAKPLRKPGEPTLAERARTQRQHSLLDLGDDQGLFQSPNYTQPESENDELTLSPEQMLKLVDPIGQKPKRSSTNKDETWILGEDK